MKQRYMSLGFLAGSNGKIVVLEDLYFHRQIRVSWDDFAAGKYDTH
jgi:hypothetical protein